MPGRPAIRAAIAKGGNQLYCHDSYYVPGTNNPAAAPAIPDPLFQQPFNPRAQPLPGNVPIHVMFRPWPCSQPGGNFPKQPKPVTAMVPAAAAGAVIPPGGAPPGPVAVVPAPPHDSLLQVLQPTNQGRAGVDWVDADPANFEIGGDVLRDVCQQAEELDYAFALRVQGLRGCALAAVWTCVDPEYDITDRKLVLVQFVKTFMERFYGAVRATAEVEDVVHEALRMHEEFCKGWVARHHRTLSAEVSAAAEALVGGFYDFLRPHLPGHLTRQHIASYLRRHPDFSAEFAHCLYHYMTVLEHGRGNRNPSYKAMGKEQAMYAGAMTRFADVLKASLQRIRVEVAGQSVLFGVAFIDWHYIAGQMPQHHRDFDAFSGAFLFRSRAGNRANALPPWQQLRM